jgi:AraC-like DNA-binding protein
MAKPDFDFESRLVPLLLAFARARGLAVEPLVAQVGLPSTALSATAGKDALITRLSSVTGLADALATGLRDEHVGLAIVDWVPRGSYGVAEFVVRSSPVLSNAFEQFVRYSALMAPSQRFAFEVQGDEARLHHSALTRANALERHLNEYTTGVLVKTLRGLAPGVALKRVWFCTERPASLERLTAWFGAGVELTFDQPDSGFAVASSALDTPVATGDPALNAYLDEHAAAALASRPRQGDLIDTLRATLREAVRAGEPSIERVAMRLNLSSRTLQRRLADLQASFQQVLDEVRFDLARAYLVDASLDLSQVAYLLGYSELRAFDRAFRRWAEQSPAEWRARR